VSVLDSIIEGVREDLAKRRRPLGELHEQMSQAPAPLDAHLAALELATFRHAIDPMIYGA